MCIAKQLDEFIKELPKSDVFIVAEGHQESLKKFFTKHKINQNIERNTDGIIRIADKSDKRGVELRLYLHENPSFIHAESNKTFMPDYEYRINDNGIILELLNKGYHIGSN